MTRLLGPARVALEKSSVSQSVGELSQAIIDVLLLPVSVGSER